MSRGGTAHPLRPATLRTYWAAIAAAGVLGVGCNDDSPFGISQSPLDQGPEEHEEPAGYTNPAALLAAHTNALERQDYSLYEKLLHGDFEYFPQSQDLIDFPWMQGLSWNKADELQMIGHMFDDNFTPADPQVVGTVDTIDAAFTIDSQQTLPDGTRQVMSHAIFTVMYATSGSGARADVRFEFRLVTAADGYLRIRSIRELPPYQRATDSSSWAMIKSCYR